MSEKIWEIAPEISQEQIDAFPELNPVVLQLLMNRQITDQEDIDVFLAPDWVRDSHHPSQFSQMTQAVNRLFEALENKEMITVHGDYDADGVCGTAVLLTTLRDICRQMGCEEAKMSSYIPHREREGYGLHAHTVEHLHKDVGTKLIVTVDCGISNEKAITQAKELGIDTIVCDHHDIPETLPDAILIHPQVPGEPYPYKHLSGTGVAFKFAHALIEEAVRRGADFHPGYEKWLLDFVAISTVTDIMPLNGENRVLERYGLLVLNKTRRVGLKKLVEVSGGTMGALDTISIGYQIGPRLNAAGRMQHADVALQLLISEDEQEAADLAHELQSLNTERQKQSEMIFQEAKRQVERNAEQSLIIVVGEGWPAGLVGLVAGRLVAAYQKPAFVIGEDNGSYVGSGRSLGGFHMTEALQTVSENLVAFGGHPQACGFSVKGKDQLELVMSGLQKCAKECIKSEDQFVRIRVDSLLPLEQIDWDFYHALQHFEPFGEKNPRPVFVTRQVRIVRLDAVGVSGKHLRLVVQSATGKKMKMIGFKLGEKIEQLNIGSLVDVVYEVSLNEWNNVRELQLVLQDIRLSDVT